MIRMTKADLTPEDNRENDQNGALLLLPCGSWPMHGPQDKVETFGRFLLLNYPRHGLKICYPHGSPRGPEEVEDERRSSLLTLGDLASIFLVCFRPHVTLQNLSWSPQNDRMLFEDVENEKEVWYHASGCCRERAVSAKRPPRRARSAFLPHVIHFRSPF